jgi:peptidyl-prolyl cis-trans isomerase D
MKALQTLQAAGTGTAAVTTGSFGEPIPVSRGLAQSLPPQLITGVLRADPSKLPATIGLDLGAMGYAVVRVNKVLPRDKQPATEVKQDRDQYAKSWAAAEAIAYYDLLKARFKTEYNVARPARSATTMTP